MTTLFEMSNILSQYSIFNVFRINAPLKHNHIKVCATEKKGEPTSSPSLIVCRWPAGFTGTYAIHSNDPESVLYEWS